MRNQKGFTLTEMMVSVSVFSLMILLTTMILRGGEEQAQIIGAKMTLQESARESLYRMATEIREASPSRVTISNGGRTLTIRIPASVDTSGSITWSSPIVYQIGGTGNQLLRRDMGTGQATVLANDIQSLTFTANGNPLASVGLSVTAQRSVTNGRTLSVTSAGEARLRNS